MSILDDPKFIAILDKQTKEFIKQDRQNLLKYLDKNGLDALKKKLKADMTFKRGWKIG